MKRRIPRGFTAVELLATIVSLGLLLAMLVPGCGEARDNHYRAQCRSNQHNVAIAFKSYEANTQSLPGWKNNYAKMTVPVSWVPVLFPYLDRQDLADLWKKTATPDKKLLEISRMKVLICPSVPPDANTSTAALAYPVNCGRGTNTRACDGVFFDLTITNPPPPKVLLSDINDGSNCTLMIGESLYTGPWHPDGEQATAISPSASPEDARTGGVGFIWEAEGGKVTDQLSSRHSGGAVVSFCDGHQKFLRDNIDYVVYQHLMTPDSAAAGIAGELRPEDY
jgi:prepilin-type processing-associated H-X9-DG protein